MELRSALESLASVNRGDQSNQNPAGFSQRKLGRTFRFLVFSGESYVNVNPRIREIYPDGRIRVDPRRYPKPFAFHAESPRRLLRSIRHMSGRRSGCCPNQTVHR